MTTVKYCLTFVNKEGLRVMAHANNGRNLWLTKKDGHQWLKQMYKVNDIDSIRQIFGEKPKFKVVQTVCYPSGDSCRTVFPN